MGMEHMVHKLEGMLKMAKLTNYEANKVRTAAGEIRDLRRRLEVAEARLSGFDSALVLLHAVPPMDHGMGMGEDVTWALEQMAEGEPDADVPPSAPPTSGGPVEDPEFGLTMRPPRSEFSGGFGGFVAGAARGDLHNQVDESPPVPRAPRDRS